MRSILMMALVMVGVLVLPAGAQDTLAESGNAARRPASRPNSDRPNSDRPNSDRPNRGSKKPIAKSNHPTTAVSGDPQAATVAFQKGTELEDRKEYHLAIAAFSEALMLDAGNAPALLHRGYCLWQIGDRVQAAVDLRQSFDIGTGALQAPAAVPANRDLASLNKDNLSFEDLLKELQSGDAGQAALRGRLFRNPKQASVDPSASAVSEIAPIAPVAPYAVAAEPNAKTAEAARKEIDRILRARTASTTANLETADRLPAAKEPAAVAPIITLEPTSASSVRTSEPIVQQSNRVTVVPDTKPAVVFSGPAKMPSDASYYLRLARLRAGASRFPSAVAAYNQAILLDPSVAPAFNGRGYAYLRMNQLDRAITDLSEALRLDPNYQNAYQNRSVARRLAGDVLGAAEDGLKVNEVKKALANPPNRSLAKRRVPESARPTGRRVEPPDENQSTPARRDVKLRL